MGVCTITYLPYHYILSQQGTPPGREQACFAGLAFLGGKGGERYLSESTGFSCYTAHG